MTGQTRYEHTFVVPFFTDQPVGNRRSDVTEETEPQVPAQAPNPVIEHRVDKALIGSGYLLQANLEPNQIAPPDIVPFVVNLATSTSSTI